MSRHLTAPARKAAAGAVAQICVLACVGCLAGAAALSAHLAYAEIQFHRGTAAAAEQAAKLDRFAPPSGYFEALADLDPDRAMHWLAAALNANPRLSPAWIAQGLAFERDSPRTGQFDQAAGALLQAASVDHQYLPAWTLANFYFRRAAFLGTSAPFWYWARRAAGLTYDDFRPLLALAHAAEADPQMAIEKLGGSNLLLHADLDYLSELGRFEDAQKIARLLLSRSAAPGLLSEAPRLLELADWQIQAGNVWYALELWNAIAAPRQEERLDPDRGLALANGDLLHAPTGVAFDWRLRQTEGALAAWRPSQLTFSLTGDQPESCALLEQTVPVARARRYRLHFEYVTAGLASPTGIVWDLDGDEGYALEPAAAWSSATAILRASNRGRRGAALGSLRLLYRRQPGTVRAQGRLELRHLRMEAL